MHFQAASTSEYLATCCISCIRTSCHHLASCVSVHVVHASWWSCTLEEVCSGASLTPHCSSRIMISSTWARHTGHGAANMKGWAQLMHVHACPQGRNRTPASASQHTTHCPASSGMLHSLSGVAVLTVLDVVARSRAPSSAGRKLGMATSAAAACGSAKACSCVSLPSGAKGAAEGAEGAGQSPSCPPTAGIDAGPPGLTAPVELESGIAAACCATWTIQSQSMPHHCIARRGMMQTPGKQRRRRYCFCAIIQQSWHTPGQHAV